MSYTKGPWKVLDGAILSDKINDYGNWIVASCNRDLTVEDGENLRLIAAAPDLLEACKELESYLRKNKNVQNMNGPEYGIWHRTISAIDKAEGRE